jgi:hypothetical protein
LDAQEISFYLIFIMSPHVPGMYVSFLSPFPTHTHTHTQTHTLLVCIFNTFLPPLFNSYDDWSNYFVFLLQRTWLYSSLTVVQGGHLDLFCMRRKHFHVGEVELTKNHLNLSILNKWIWINGSMSSLTL